MRRFMPICGCFLSCALLASLVWGATVSAADELSFYPLNASQLERRVRTADGSGTETAAGAAEKPVYGNRLGTSVFELAQGAAIADDLTLMIQAGCPLTRYTFEVVGVVNPAGPTGSYRVDYALYDNCPGAGGVIIPGTNGSVVFSEATHGPGFDTTIQTVEVAPPVLTLLNPTVWLGLRSNRTNTGVVGGAPALVGFSSDRVDFPGFACNADAGGFPMQPHASFNAQVWVDAACADAFPGYRDIQPGRGGFTEGANKCMADDVRLNVPTCNMVALDATVRGIGIYKFDVRSDIGGFPGDVIPGTSRSQLVPGGTSGARVLRFTFDPPISLGPIDPAGTKVWVTFEGNNAGAGWILTRQNAQIGDTAFTYGRSISGADCATVSDWELVTPVVDPGRPGAFDVQIYCNGTPPVGACCDRYLRDDHDRPVCRDVPGMNCTQGLEWVGGTACDADPFEEPCLSASPCTVNADCDDGIPCTVDVCVFGECVYLLDDTVCDDSLFCNGAESCERCPERDRCCLPSGSCMPDTSRRICLLFGGTPDCLGFHCASGTPVSCPDDAIACTVAQCDEANDQCAQVPNHAACADGVFCNGVERCDVATGCRPALRVPCPANLCDEARDRCRIRPDAALHGSSEPK